MAGTQGDPSLLWSAYARGESSVPAAAAVKASAAKHEQDDEDDQKCVGIHGSLLGEMESGKASAVQRSWAFRCSTLLLSGHFIPLIAKVFLDAVHLLPGILLHRDKGRTCRGIIGLRKIERGHERATASAYLGRGIADLCCSH